jgi:hypothetical protein
MAARVAAGSAAEVLDIGFDSPGRPVAVVTMLKLVSQSGSGYSLITRRMLEVV